MSSFESLLKRLQPPMAPAAQVSTTYSNAQNMFILQVATSKDQMWKIATLKIIAV